MNSSYRLGTLAILSIVALRLAIGWHFFREGADKLVSGTFTSVGFMKVSKGPLTPLFHWFIWDEDGRARLDRIGTLEAWDQYREQVANHYGFDPKQAAKAKEVQKFREEQFTYLLDDNAGDIDEYYKGLDRRDKYRQDDSRMEVASLRGQVDTIEGELGQKLSGWLTSIDAMWKGLEKDLNALATPEQAGRGHLALGKPGRKPMDTVFIDQIIPTFDLLVGILLIFGLFTRITSLAGAGFLAMIVATQVAGGSGSDPGPLSDHRDVRLPRVGCDWSRAIRRPRFPCQVSAAGSCCPPKTEKK